MFSSRRFSRQDFMQRLPMNDEQFIQEIQLTGSFSKTFVNCCRSALGQSFQVEPDKIYSTDTWRDIYRLGCANWDILEIILLLEDNLGLEISEEQVPFPTHRQQFGHWVAEFISRCS